MYNKINDIIITPILTDNIRDIAYYCLAVDPCELEDVSLLGLSRLKFILTILERKTRNQLPENSALKDKYIFILQSFGELINCVFNGLPVYQGDPLNKESKDIISIIDLPNSLYLTFNERGFDELVETIKIANRIH